MKSKQLHNFKATVYRLNLQTVAVKGMSYSKDYQN